MQALLRMIDTEDDLRRAMAVCSAKKVRIVHRKHQRKLDEDIIRSGGFNTSFRGYRSHCILGLGATFGDRWRLTGRPDPRGKPFTGLRVLFVGPSWDVRELQEAWVAKAGGRVVDDWGQANVIVVSNIHAASVSPGAAALMVTPEVFRRALPAARLIPPAVRSKPLSDQAAILWKLLSSRDLRPMQQGVNLAGTLSGEFDDLLEGVEVDEAGELVWGPHFSITRDAQPFLDGLLLSLLSVAPGGTRAAALRAAVRKIVTTAAGIPKLTGFEMLEELQLTLSGFTNAKDLSAFGPLPALRELFIEPARNGAESADASLTSLDGLEAPALEQLSIRFVDLRDVDALGSSTRLQSVDLSGNSRLKRIDGLAPAASSLQRLNLSRCRYIESIGPLEGAKQLRQVVLQGCTTLVSVKPLSSCEAFDELDLWGCSGLTSLEGLAATLVGGTGFSLGHCKRLTSLTGLPTNITSLDLDGCVRLRTLAGLEALRALKTVWLPPTITDASALAHHRHLTIAVSLPELVTFPEGLGKALSVLSRVKLAIRCGYCLEDGSGLAAITSLVYLDLRDCQNLKDISWVVGLPSLKRLYLAEGSPATKQAKARHFDTRTKVRELQLAICAKKKIPLPPHLACVPR